MEGNTLTVRVRDGGELKDIELADFVSRVKDENITRR
jgi:threonyl-tRNA synthetase